MKQLDSGTVGKNLGALLAAGEPVEITRYGRVVGHLIPTEQPDPAEKDAEAVVTDAPEVAVDITGWITEPHQPAARVLPAAVEPQAKTYAQRNPQQTARDDLLGRINRGRKER